jgi:GNAT superfamily N-acetyltransferase
MAQQGTCRLPPSPADARKVSAARIMAAAFGAGLLGLEHGFFEARQGSAALGGLVIHAIGSPCQPHAAWHGCEPALTVIPSFRATGIAAMLLALAVLIWAAALVTRPHGGLVLLLVVALFVSGGGFTTFWFGLLAGIAATQITAPPTRWRTWLGSRVTRLLAWLWPGLFLAYLAWAAASWIVAAISNAVMFQVTPAVTASTPFVLAHHSQQSRTAPQPESPPPNGRDEHVEVRQADMDGTLTFEPVPSGTRMRWSWQVRPKKAARLLAPLITWMGSREEQRIWASTKRYLENTAARPVTRPTP